MYTDIKISVRDLERKVKMTNVITESDLISEVYKDDYRSLADKIVGIPNIWTKPIPTETEIRTSTPVLADYLNHGKNFRLIRIMSTYITGTKYCPLKLNSEEYYIPKHTWISLNIDKNKYDPHAVTFRVSAADFKSVKDNCKVDSSKFDTDTYSAIWLSCGHVDKDDAPIIKQWLKDINCKSGYDLHLPLSSEIGQLHAITHAEENIAGYITSSKQYRDHWNYNVEIFVATDPLNQIQMHELFRQPVQDTGLNNSKDLSDVLAKFDRQNLTDKFL